MSMNRRKSNSNDPQCFDFSWERKKMATQWFEIKDKSSGKDEQARRRLCMKKLGLYEEGMIAHRYERSIIHLHKAPGGLCMRYSSKLMAETQSHRLFNPCLLHLQKLALELKCPLCLNLLNRPILLPCDHIFCNGCIRRPIKLGSECPSCKCQYADQDIRPAPSMEKIVTIYKSLTATSFDTLTQPISCDAAKNISMCLVSEKTNSDDGTGKEIHEVTADGNSSSGTFQPLLANNSSHDIGNAEGRLNHFQSLGENRNVKHEEIIMDEIDMNPTGQLSPGCAILLGKVDDCDPGSSRDAKRHKSESEDRNEVCAFCHSSEVSDETGKMLHYANGKEVAGDLKPFSKGIHIHRICIDWTPQVYYEGDNIRNLESELARASKLKCTKCGLKGAGLGCYMRSCRRSYHVTCALKTPDCRWDHDDFIMLCPIHRAVKFPKEKTKSRKARATTLKAEPLVAPIVPQQANFWSASLGGAKEWLFCGSALSYQDKCYLVKFGSSCGATVSRCWMPNVTHVIAAVDANGAYTRTLKVLMAILNGRWIVTMDWIKACKEAGKPVDEEPYELGLDNHGCRAGPKTGRLQALQKAPKLFSGLNFYFSGDFLPAYKNELLNLVTTAGGLVIQNREQLAAKSYTKQEASTTLVIYNVDPIQQYTLQNEETVLLQRLLIAEDLAKEFGYRVLKHTWILESIAACMLQPC